MSRLLLAFTALAIIAFGFGCAAQSPIGRMTTETTTVTVTVPTQAATTAANATQPPASPTVTPPGALDATDLWIAYNSGNSVAADLKYKGKTLTVTGIVTSIRSDIFGKPTILFGMNMFFGIEASFDKSYASQVASLSPGQMITVIGVCDGQLSAGLNIELKSASVVKVTTPMPTTATASPPKVTTIIVNPSTPVTPSTTTAVPLTTTPQPMPTGSISFNLPPQSVYLYQLNLTQGDTVNVSVNASTKIINDPIKLTIIAPDGHTVISSDIKEWIGVIQSEVTGAYRFEFRGSVNSATPVKWEYTSKTYPKTPAHQAVVESMTIPGFGYLAFDGVDLWEVKSTSISKLSNVDLSKKTEIPLSLSLPLFPRVAPGLGSKQFVSAHAFTPGHIWVGVPGPYEPLSQMAFRIDLNNGEVEQYSAGGIPRGLAYDGERIWILANSQNRFVLTLLKETTGAMIQQLQTESGYTNQTSIVFAGDGVWASSAGNELNKLSPDGKVLLKLTNYIVYLNSMAYDGKSLWVSAIYQAVQNKPPVVPLILKIRPEDGTILESLPHQSSNGELHGLIFDGEYLWALGGGGYCKMKVGGGTVNVVSTVPVGGDFFLQPPVFDGENIWTRYPDSYTLVKIRVKP